MMLLGDWATPSSPALYHTSRTSDWIVHYFRVFRSVTGDRFWDDVRVAHQNAIASIQANFSSATGLLPDFARITDAGVEPVDGRVLESDHDGDYGFNACRTPWRIGLDAITSGDRTSVNAVRKMNQWAVSATRGDPAALGTGYTLSGRRYGAGNDGAFRAPFAVAAMTDAGSQAWLDALWATMASGRISRERYFGSTIQLQVMIIVSGRYTPL